MKKSVRGCRPRSLVPGCARTHPWAPGTLGGRALAHDARVRDAWIGRSQLGRDEGDMILVGGLEHFLFSQKYWVANHPNWLSYFSEGWPNHQPGYDISSHKPWCINPGFSSP